MVLVPFSNKVSVSQKIESNEEKKRLKKLVQSIKPPGFGVIIRTVAQGKMVAELDADIKFLYKKWQKMYKQTKKVTPPAKVLGELGRTASLLRDVLNDDFVSILVNDEKLYSEIKINWLPKKILPELTSDSEISSHDSSTNGLINAYKNMKA